MRHRAKDDLRTAIAEMRQRGWSLPRIGRAVGKHHTTVLYHLERMAILTPKEWGQFLVNRGAGL